MAIYQVTYVKRAAQSEGSIVPEERTEIINADTVVHEEPFLNFYGDGLVLSVRESDVRVVRQMGLPPVEPA